MINESLSKKLPVIRLLLTYFLQAFLHLLLILFFCWFFFFLTLCSKMFLCFDTAGNTPNDYINNYALGKPRLITEVNIGTTKFSHESFSGLQ